MNVEQVGKLMNIINEVARIADSDPQVQYFADGEKDLIFHLEITIKK